MATATFCHPSDEIEPHAVIDPDLIVRIASRGEGVTADGRHVPLAAPGDRLLAGGGLQIGPGHADPVCRHYPTCGGCQLQHIDDPSYATYLGERIGGALHAQGIDCPPLRTPHISPPCARRRVALRAARNGRKLALGLNEAGSHRLVDLAECHVMLPELFALIAPLRILLGAILPDREAAGVTMTRADQGIDLLLTGVALEGLASIDRLTDFCTKNALARVSIDEGWGPNIHYSSGSVTISLGGIPVDLPEGAFLQATADGEAALVHAVVDATTGARCIADLFAGLGTFALALPGKVHAVEGARDAALALLATRRVSVEHRDLFRRPLSVSELKGYDGIVLDPPRAGAKEQMVALAQSGTPRIAYVSCNPATFARDARVLIDGGYRIDWIKPVGQFRWSTHVELAAAFSR